MYVNDMQDERCESLRESSSDVETNREAGQWKGINIAKARAGVADPNFIYPRIIDLNESALASPLQNYSPRKILIVDD